ncbi:MAG: LLM class F420-dependent oxidoreductase [Pseudomonadota bacterium]
MQISVVFPNVMYREGPAGVKRLIQGIEAIGFDELSMFDHVVMGYPTETRRAPFYSPTMPIMEAFTVLAHASAITSTIGLGTRVLVLPQRQPVLVARQAASLDMLSGGRLRLGVGIGWQRSEYEALGEAFDGRGARFEEAIELLRACWRDEHVIFDGAHYRADDIAFEPKPGREIPLWIGGTRPKQLERVARFADGWMGMSAPGDPPLQDKLDIIFAAADKHGRDPASIELQMGLSPGPLQKEANKRFYAEPELMLERALELKAIGFSMVSLDTVPIFQLGHRSSEAMLAHLEKTYATLSAGLSD